MVKRKSNKQSHTLELPDFTYFTDRNLGKAFPIILKDNGFNVEIHDDHFAQDTTDTEWLNIVGSKGWVVITRDKYIKKRSYEVDALMTAKIKSFFVIGKAPFPDLANNIVKSKFKLSKFINKNNYPFMAKIYMPAKAKSLKSGEIKMWYTQNDWILDKLKN